jgi:Tfp pilus assembly protein PilF
LPEKAAEDWQNAVEIAHHKDEVYISKARIYEHRGEIEEARQTAQKALEINPDNRAAQGILKRL